MLSRLLDDHAPRKRRTANREHVPFMTPELLEAIRKRKKFKRYYKKSKCRLYWDRYKRKAVYITIFAPSPQMPKATPINFGKWSSMST